MALNWDATRCNEVVMNEDNLEKTQYFCFVLMGIGIPSITEENYVGAYKRANLYEALEGNFYKEGRLTLVDFELRIGYHTNVSLLTLKEFNSHVLDRHYKLEAVSY